jgi:hypothetical protein
VIIELDWSTTESLPDPPPLQAWAEFTTHSDAKRKFILVPHCPTPGEQYESRIPKAAPNVP